MLFANIYIYGDTGIQGLEASHVWAYNQIGLVPLCGPEIGIFRSLFKEPPVPFGASAESLGPGVPYHNTSDSTGVWPF